MLYPGTNVMTKKGLLVVFVFTYGYLNALPASEYKYSTTRPLGASILVRFHVTIGYSV